MTRDLSPIPTWHADVLFRSGLEARHAVLFDQLGIKWDYEEQGYDADGTWYRPDFVLFPALGTLWAEVKPRWDNDPAGVARWRKFAAWRPPPSRAALLVGVPEIGRSALVVGGTEDDPANGIWEDDTQEWRPCPSGQHFDLAFPGVFKSKFAEDGCPYSDPDGRGEARLKRAFRAARSARFDRKPPPPETAA